MFEEMRRELRRLEGEHQIEVSVEFDEHGYLDRQCPADDCLFDFKVYGKDWLNVVEEAAFCPFCGRSESSEEWNTQEQSEHFRKVAMSQIQGRLGRAMRRDAQVWNRRQPRNSFVNVTMKVEGRPRLVSLPPAAAEPMRLRIECSRCDCRYAVIGAAFFCPACGHNDAELQFNLALTGIRNGIVALREIKASLLDRDTTENTVRGLLEYGLLNAVTAFQRYAEVLYLRVVPNGKPRRNSFQNLATGNNLWSAATGEEYSYYLTSDEMTTLRRGFQQRHLLAHTQGIVDQDYIDYSGDNSYKVGQRVVINETMVTYYVDIIERLAIGLLGAVAKHVEHHSEVKIVEAQADTD